jgi:competence protein ComEA
MDPHPSPPTARHRGYALAALAVALVGVLGARGYGDRPRPTELQPVAVQRQVDLNTAERAELLQVPGVGPALADAILTHRREAGRFDTVDDLDRVRGVGGKTLDHLRPWVTVSDPVETDRPVETLERKPTPPPAPTGTGKIRPGDSPIDVNTAPVAELMRLPGVGPVLAERIADHRNRERFATPDDLRKVKGIGPKTLEAIRPFVVCK